MTTNKIDLNIQELEKWFYKNYQKKNFKDFNLSNIKKIVQTLKIKKYLHIRKMQ